MISRILLPDQIAQPPSPADDASSRFTRASVRITLMFSDIVYHSLLGIITQTFLAVLVLLGAYAIDAVWTLKELPVDYGRKALEVTSIIPVILLLNKDFYGAQSVMKRVWGFKVVDYQTGATATELQCMVRNISIIAFPIEGLISLLSPERRLGDFLAGTRVIRVEPKSSKQLLTEIREKRIGQYSWLTIAASAVAAGLIFFAQD